MEDDPGDDPFMSEELEFETQTDILTLLENVRCQGINHAGLKQAFLALSTICSSNVGAQDYFRLAGGVADTANLIETSSCPLSALPAALFCLACAVKKNVSSQNMVLNGSVFTAVQRLLASEDEKIVDSTAFFLACAVADNGRGQQLINETGCLKELLNILRRYLQECHTDENKWSIVTRAMAVCVNNPQNERNQGVCCKLLPLALKFISSNSHNWIIRHVLVLITSVVANNVLNQNRVRNCGGLEEIANLIKEHHKNHKDVKVSIIVFAVSALDACIADNATSGIKAGDMEMISVILKIIENFDLEPADLKTLLLAVAHILESHEKFSRHITEGRAYDQMVKLLTISQDEELFKTIKYIFTLCKDKDKMEDGDLESGISLDQTARNFMEAINKKLEILSAKIEKKEDFTKGCISEEIPVVTLLQGMPSEYPHSEEQNQFSLKGREAFVNNQNCRQAQRNATDDMLIIHSDLPEVCARTGKDSINNGGSTFEIQDYNGSCRYAPYLSKYASDQILPKLQMSHRNIPLYSRRWKESGEAHSLKSPSEMKKIYIPNTHDYQANCQQLNPRKVGEDISAHTLNNEAQTFHRNTLSMNRQAPHKEHKNPWGSSNHVQNTCFPDGKSYYAEAPENVEDCPRSSKWESDSKNHTCLDLMESSQIDPLNSKCTYQHENAGNQKNHFDITNKTVSVDKRLSSHSGKADSGQKSSEDEMETRKRSFQIYQTEPYENNRGYQKLLQSDYINAGFINGICMNDAIQNRKSDSHGDDPFENFNCESYTHYQNGNDEYCVFNEKGNNNCDDYLDHPGGSFHGNGCTDLPIGNFKSSVCFDRPNKNINGNDCADYSNKNFNGNGCTDSLNGNFNGNCSIDHPSGNLNDMDSNHHHSRNLNVIDSNDKPNGNLNGNGCNDQHRGNFSNNGGMNYHNRNVINDGCINYPSGNFNNSCINHAFENFKTNISTRPSSGHLHRSSCISHTSCMDRKIGSSSSCIDHQNEKIKNLHSYLNHETGLNGNLSNGFNNIESDDLNISCIDYFQSKNDETNSDNTYDRDILQRSQLDLLSHFQKVVNSLMSFIPGAVDSCQISQKDSLAAQTEEIRNIVDENLLKQGDPTSFKDLLSRPSTPCSFGGKENSLASSTAFIKKMNHGISSQCFLNTCDYLEDQNSTTPAPNTMSLFNTNNSFTPIRDESVGVHNRNHNRVQAGSKINIARNDFNDQNAKADEKLAEAEIDIFENSCTVMKPTFVQEAVFAKPSELKLKAHNMSKATTRTSKIRHAGTPQSFYREAFMTSSSFTSPQRTNQQLANQPPQSPALSAFDLKLQTIARSRGMTPCDLFNTSSQFRLETPRKTHIVPVKNIIKSKQSSRNSIFNNEEDDEDTSCTLNGSETDSTKSESLTTRESTTFDPSQKMQGKINVPLHADDERHVLTPTPTSSFPPRQTGQAGVVACPHESTGSLQEINLPECKTVQHCPGCAAGQNLNSRTFNIAIETSRNTCTYHRTVRELEREEIKQHTKQLECADGRKCSYLRYCSLSPINNKNDVYNFSSEDDKKPLSSCMDVSMRSIQKALQKKANKKDRQSEVRRPRVPYSEQELANLKEGVTVMGRRWQQILCTYQFHPSRTSVDLKDKYKRITMTQRNGIKQQCCTLPFSMCEVRRLKRGVKMFGYNWKAILTGGKFLHGRTDRDLKDKWKALNKVSSNQFFQDI